MGSRARSRPGLIVDRGYAHEQRETLEKFIVAHAHGSIAERDDIVLAALACGQCVVVERGERVAIIETAGGLARVRRDGERRDLWLIGAMVREVRS